jgi:hypothetical protein
VARKERRKTKQQTLEEINKQWDDKELEQTFVAAPDGKVVRHNECIFYANDHWKIRWVHANEKAKPYAK